MASLKIIGGGSLGREHFNPKKIKKKENDYHDKNKKQSMQLCPLTRWTWQRILPMVFLPIFSRGGLARIPFICVQEGGWCQFSNATHSQIVNFPIFPFIKPVNHSGSSGCGGEGKVIRSVRTLMVTLSNPFNLYLNILYKIPTKFQEQGTHYLPATLLLFLNWNLCIY